MTGSAATKEWPTWARTWYGYALRILVAIWGVVAGLALILIGYYTAVDWKTGESDWTFAAGATIVAGMAITLYSVIGAVRPTKVTLLPPLILLGVTSAAALISAMADFARDLASK